jgi:diguanylate cyclase (GGDEF)-like protein
MAVPKSDKHRMRYLEALLDHVPAPMAYLSTRREFVWVNKAFAQTLGVAREQLLGQPSARFMAPEVYMQGTPCFNEALSGRSSKMEVALPVRGALPNSGRGEPPPSATVEGQVRWYELNWAPDTVDGRVQGVFAVFRDIHDAKLAYDSLVRAAQIDALTGLLNRRSFMEDLKKRFAAHASGKVTSEIVVLFMDLDGFKPINDDYGHGVGDQFLQGAAARIRDSLRGTDIAARIGGDEFIVCFNSAQPRTAAKVLCERLIATLSSPMMVDGHELRVSASIGVAFTPAHGSDADSLIKRADEAMYRAKRDGKARFEFARLG